MPYINYKEISMNYSMLSISHKVSNDILFVSLAGTVDGHNIREFEVPMMDMCNSKYKSVVADFSGVNYMSSIAVGAVIRFYRTVIGYDGSLVISGMQHRVFEVFQLLGFTSILTFADSVEDSVEMLNNKKSPFPAIVKCVICSRKLKAIRSGFFKCPSCATVLSVANNAHVMLR
jgi:anti-sigma B factor antagonist